MPYEIEADTEHNRLYMTVSGRMDRSEVEAAVEEAKHAVEELEDGFDIVNDLSGLRPISPEDASPIKEAQEYVLEHNVDRVIRIVDEDTSNVIVQMFERRSQRTGYSGETADSVSEAEHMLTEQTIAGYTDH